MAKKVMKNTYVDFELETGEVVKLTLTYFALYKIKRAMPKVYDEYNRIAVHGPKEELDMATILYAGYLCGIVMQGGDIEDAYEYEEFLSMVTPDREYINDTFMRLYKPKKATASDERS